MTPEQLEREVLSEASCPWSRVLRGQGERVMSVRTLRRFAEAQGFDADAVEAAMNQYVVEQDGKRQKVIATWSALPNIFRRVRGRAPETDDVWRIPDAN
jgi:hypothetical protein